MMHSQTPYLREPSLQVAPSTPLPIDVLWLRRAEKLCYGVLLLVLALVGARALLLAPLFNINHLKLSGDTQFHNALTIRANILPQLSGNYFTLDVRQAQAQFEALPWIRSAVVRREFPNALRVQLTAHEPVARWSTLGGLQDGSERLLNRQGEVFEAVGGQVDTQALPALAGPLSKASQVWSLYQSLEKLLTESAKQAGADAPSQALASLRLTEHGLWQAELASDAKVELGSGDAAQVLVRASRWLAALPSAADKLNVKASAALGSLQSADLRYGQGFAVRWAGITTR